MDAPNVKEPEVDVKAPATEVKPSEPEIKTPANEVKPSEILELANIQTLTQVTLMEDNRDLLSIAQELKYRKPDCLIKLNHQAIY
jgi:hypothetical protein